MREERNKNARFGEQNFCSRYIGGVRMMEKLVVEPTTTSTTDRKAGEREKLII